MKILLTSILLFFCIYNSLAQTILIDGENTKRKLVWDDFSGKVDKSSEYKANTFWTLNYRFSGISFKGDTAIIKGFESTLEFDKKFSWIKIGFDTPELLKHEQGHFDIGILCQKEFLQTVKTTILFKSNFSETLQKLFKTVLKKYTEMGTLYDTETDHSKNTEAQIKWNSFFETALIQ